jgi:hypothetical protein
MPYGLARDVHCSAQREGGLSTLGTAATAIRPRLPRERRQETTKRYAALPVCNDPVAKSLIMQMENHGVAVMRSSLERKS